MDNTDKTYTYIGPLTDDKPDASTYEFDNNRFNRLLVTKRYTEAANYAKNFMPNDPALRKQYESNINILKNKGRKIEAIYASVGYDKSKLDNLDFTDAVFNPSLMDELYNERKNSAVNSYCSEKVQLGWSYDKPEPANLPYATRAQPDFRNRDTDAVKLEFCFAQPTQTLAGVDWMAPDNPNTLDNFLKQSGYTMESLKQQGVYVERKNSGYGFISFNKNSKISNELLYKLTKFATIQTANGESPTKHSGYAWDLPVIMRVYNSKGKELTGYISSKPLERMAKLIDDAKDTSTQVIDDLKTNKNYLKNYSSTKMSLASDDLIELEESYAKGEITPSQYASMRKRYVGELDHFVKTLSGKDITFYTDYDYDSNEKKYEDMSLHIAPQEYNDEIVQMLSETNTNRLHYDVQTANGKIGLLVTVDGEANSKGEKIYDKKQIWIPMDERYGSLYGKLKNKINSDTYGRAAEEINDMQAYGYSYSLRDDKNVSVNNGEFFVDGSKVSKEEAIRTINKDMIIESAIHNIKFKYMNQYGELINPDECYLLCMKTAIAAVNELTPDVPLAHSDGRPLTLDEIITNTENLTQARQEQNYALYNKLKEIYDIYNEMIDSINK